MLRPFCVARVMYIGRLAYYYYPGMECCVRATYSLRSRRHGVADTATAALICCSSVKFPNIYRLLTILGTLPVTTC